jgi:uncharacterized protein YjeT (DUF2065 family)
VTDFLTALGLALAIEGVAYALFPGAMQRMMARMLATPPHLLRIFGLVAAISGVLAVWLVRRALIAP